MKIEINGNYIKLTGKNNKAIVVTHLPDDDVFLLGILQNGFEIGCLPMVTFCKDHTIVLNNLAGKSIY